MGLRLGGGVAGRGGGSGRVGEGGGEEKGEEGKGREREGEGGKKREEGFQRCGAIDMWWLYMQPLIM